MEVGGEAWTLQAGLGCAGRVGAGKQGHNHRGKGSTCRGKSIIWESDMGSKRLMSPLAQEEQMVHSKQHN